MGRVRRRLSQRWSKGPIGGETRPQAFDIVTGVSTGALQATYAFLGAAQDDALGEAYAITSERQLVRRHGGLFFLGHASMADNAPLLDQVAAADPSHRLYVGIVDGLSGRMRAVDLTRMARELTGAERLDCYVGALLGSSAVPVVFRQVRIGGVPFFDGGVRQSVFVAGVASAASAARVRLGKRIEARYHHTTWPNPDPRFSAIASPPASGTGSMRSRSW